MSGTRVTADSTDEVKDPVRSYGSYASFSDPDGNEWALQEVQERLPGRGH